MTKLGQGVQSYGTLPYFTNTIYYKNSRIKLRICHISSVRKERRKKKTFRVAVRKFKSIRDDLKNLGIYCIQLNPSVC